MNPFRRQILNRPNEYPYASGKQCRVINKTIGDARMEVTKGLDEWSDNDNDNNRDYVRRGIL